MGVFDWFGKIFSREEQVEVIVPLRDLEDWVDKHTSSLVEENNVGIKQKHDEILNKKDQTKALLNKLREAKLQNPHIEPKMLQFMSGNRDNYIQQVGIFINNLPKLNDNFYSEFQDALNNLTKRTERSYQILQEFFANESKSIAMRIREMDELSKEINKLKTSGKMSRVNEIKQKIKEIAELKALKEKMFNKIESAENKLNEDKKRIEELSREIEEKKKSEEFNNYSKQVAEREKLTVKLKMLDAEVNELFSPLKRAFKKFRRITLSHDHEALIDKYLGSPLIGLIDDRNFNVLTLFGEINNKMTSLNLTEREEIRVRQQIMGIKKEKLHGYSVKYEELKQQLVEIKEKIQQNSILQGIEKLEQEIGRLNQAVKRTEIELEEENKKKDAFDIDEKLKKVQLLINDSLGTNICVK